MKSLSKQDKYSHTSVQEKIRDAWIRFSVNYTPIESSKKPFYNLMMFPYPSAEGLHVGNMYAFTGTDMYGRFKRMQGYDVFEPIGLDGFGIHSENYAMKIGRHPMEHAKVTEKNYYNQLKRIGAMYDWDRKLETYDPTYYRWTQWLFVMMFKHGLAYRDTASVNWCPKCKTVLADEQVIDGKCERCGSSVEKRDLKQWFFRITEYAEKLLGNLRDIDWSEKVKIAQEQWIGKKTGITITYRIVNSAGKEIGFIDCFTTRPDTNFGATFVVLAPEHPFISKLSGVIEDERIARIRKYCDEASHKSDQERQEEGKKKTGVDTGLYCINSLNGHKMPLFISDFVLMGFGTGAVVGVPGHDKRDFEFAQVMKLPVIRVVVGKDGDKGPITTLNQVQEEEGTMINSEFLDGMDIHKATIAMMDHLEAKGWGKRTVTYHLRDWLISRQRYWGPPIPMIYCEVCAKEGKSWFTTKEAEETLKHGGPSVIGNWKLEIGNSALWAAGWYPVSEDQLPVELPFIEDFKPSDDGIAPLAKHKEFYETTCPGCGSKAVRETDVSDTFLDSSWYFLRYPSIGVAEVANEKHGSDRAFDPQITKKWLPVNMYTGGAEHSVLHLMYSRFVTMALKDWGYLDFEEPFTKFFAHGLVIKDGAKMSKSKGNVVNPDEYIVMYGSDALRLYLMFMGPFSQGGDFRDAAMEGMSRWVNRVWKLGISNINNSNLKSQISKVQIKTQSLKTEDKNEEIEYALHRLVKKVGEDIEKRSYNTAIAAMMEFTNLVTDHGGSVSSDMLKTFLLILAPFSPFLTEELWQQMHGRDTLTSKEDSIHVQLWPSYDPKKIIRSEVTIAIQVNGKVRDIVTVESSAAMDKEVIAGLAEKQPNVQKHLEGKTIKKTIVVPGKIVNFVVA